MQNYIDLKWIFIGLGTLGLVSTVILQIWLVEPKKRDTQIEVQRTMSKIQNQVNQTEEKPPEEQFLQGGDSPDIIYEDDFVDDLYAN